MQKKLLFVLPLLALAAVSCSDDKDEPAGSAAQAAGTYEGYTEAGSTYFSGMLATDQKVVITETASDKVSVAYVSDTWGTFSIAGATVKQSGNTCTLSGTGTAEMGMGGNVKSYDCTFSGKVAGGSGEFTFSLPSVMGGLTINFTQGQIPAAKVVPYTYEGYSKADCAFFQDMYEDDQTLTVTAEAGDTYKVAYTSDTFGEYVIEGLKATRDGSEFKLSGEGTCTMGMNGNMSDYACTLEAEIDDDREDATFKFSVPAVMGGLTVEFKTGTRTTDD